MPPSELRPCTRLWIMLDYKLCMDLFCLVNPVPRTDLDLLQGSNLKSVISFFFFLRHNYKQCFGKKPKEEKKIKEDSFL